MQYWFLILQVAMWFLCITLLMHCLLLNVCLFIFILGMWKQEQHCMFDIFQIDVLVHLPHLGIVLKDCFCGSYQYELIKLTNCCFFEGEESSNLWDVYFGEPCQYLLAWMSSWEAWKAKATWSKGMCCMDYWA